MHFSIQVDPDMQQVLAIYLKSVDGRKVHRTVEVAENACYADEDNKVNLLGIEMLAPGQLGVNIRQIVQKYRVAGLTKAIRNVKQVFA